MQAKARESGTGKSSIPQRLTKQLERFICGENTYGFSFPKEQVQDLLALILLAYPDARRTGAPPAAGASLLLGSFAARAGVRSSMSPVQFNESISAYINRNPPHLLLIEKLAELVKEAVAEGAMDQGSAFAKFAANPTRKLWTTGRPAGSIQAGPLASFLLRANQTAAGPPERDGSLEKDLRELN